MAKTIVIVGFGPGNATAIAEKFGAEGFTVALIGRNQDRLTAGVSALRDRRITAGAFIGDAADAASMRAAFSKIRAELGPIHVMNWNAGILTPDTGDFLTGDPAAFSRVFDIAVFGLIAAVNELLPDLKSAGDGAVLITNGGFGDPLPEIDAAVIKMNLAGMALANAAKHKLAGLLSARLKGDGVYVGEVMIYGTVKRTSSDPGDGVDPATVASKFWELYTSRGELRGRVGASA